MSLVSNTDREYILAAAKHRRQLQQSDTESIFDIAARLKKAVEAARAADARRKPADDAALSDTDLSLHRPGWRLNDDSTWRHDRRKKERQKNTTQKVGSRQPTFLAKKRTTKTRETAIDLRRHSATVKPLAPNISTTSTMLINRGVNGCATSPATSP
jgi:hypothetical protein